MELAHKAIFARRQIVIAVVAVGLAFLYTISAYFDTFDPLAAGYGWIVQPDGVIQNVAPGSPAQRAGLQAGDRILFSKMPFGSTFRVAGFFGSRSGHRMPITVQTQHGIEHVVVVAMRPPARSVQSEVIAALLSLQGLLFLAIGTFVALRRPDAVGLWFFTFSTMAAPSGQITVFFSFLPDPIAAVPFGIALFWLASALGSATLMMFAFYFPDGRITPIKKRLSPLVALIVVISVAEAASETFRALSGDFNVYPWSFSLDNSAIIVALILFCVEYVHSNAAMRTRLFWVFLALGFEALVIASGPLYPLAPVAYVWLLASSILVPITLAYAILRHQMFDITFTINRAIAYTTLTAALALGIGLLDWAAEGFIGQRKLAIALEALVALGFGIVLDKLQSFLERYIDLVLFRERHAMEREIERLISSLQFADSYEAVGAATVDHVITAMRLASAALFLRQDDGRYRRAYSHNWHAAHRSVLTTSDAVLRVVHEERAPIRIADLRWDSESPTGVASPVVAIPLVARNELFGVLLYGMHANGLAVDPAELDLLKQLGRAAAGALDSVEARATRIALEEARQKLAELQRI